MDDLEDLQARVAAAQEKLRLNADDQRKYGLRLNDVVTIVEGSLARQQDEMKRLQDTAVALRLESDAARVAETKTKSLYEAALARLNQLQAQNEQLRNMVLTLLNVIEGREAPSALQAVVQRLESTVHETAQAKPAAVPAAEATAPAAAIAEGPAADMAETEAFAAAETEALGDHEELEELAAEDQAEAVEQEAILEEPAETDAAMVDFDEAGTASGPVEGDAAEAAGEEEVGEDETDTAATSSFAAEPVADAAIADADTNADHAMEMMDAGEEDAGEDIEAESSDIAAAEDMPEDLDALSMNGNRDFVTDADEIVANEALADAVIEAEPVHEAESHQQVTQQDENLVTALLDAEKALIEAGASGVANANSPVAEIIRRISLRTREFSEASGS